MTVTVTTPWRLTTLAACVMAATMSPAARQERQPPRVPARGSTVVAEGCLTSSSLQATMTTLAGDESGDGLAQPISYQLRGNAALLTRLHKEQDGRTVRVTGVLKSRLPGSESHGRTFGRTTVVVGTPPSTGAAPRPQESLPILEVKSFEDGGTTCG